MREWLCDVGVVVVSVSWPTVVCNQCTCVGGGEGRHCRLERGGGGRFLSIWDAPRAAAGVSVARASSDISLLYLNLSTNYLVCCSEDAFFSRHSVPECGSEFWNTKIPPQVLNLSMICPSGYNWYSKLFTWVITSSKNTFKCKMDIFADRQ